MIPWEEVLLLPALTARRGVPQGRALQDLVNLPLQIKGMEAKNMMLSRYLKMDHPLLLHQKLARPLHSRRCASHGWLFLGIDGPACTHVQPDAHAHPSWQQHCCISFALHHRGVH